jgi:hypothetical protein
MTDLQKQIDEIETKAAESALIANLATDPEARAFNTRLTQELRERVERLRQQLHPCGTDQLMFVAVDACWPRRFRPRSAHSETTFTASASFAGMRALYFCSMSGHRIASIST